jgi:hypothetical protein
VPRVVPAGLVFLVVVVVGICVDRVVVVGRERRERGALLSLIVVGKSDEQ